MNPPVWLYWEGPMPPYIRLCLDLLKAYNPSARVLGPEDLPGLVPITGANQALVSETWRAMLAAAEDSPKACPPQ